MDHVDFSSDSEWLQTTSQSTDITFFSARTGMLQPSALSMRDVDWARHTCPLGWAVQGAWPSQDDGTVVTSAARSWAGDTLAVGDNFGHVRLVRFPAPTRGCGRVSYRAHGTNVRRARFSAADEYLVTVGGDDRAVCQWK